MFILSYPRAGSNFLHYCIKEITGIDIGKTHAQNKEFWSETQSGKLIFIIRNYKESIPRQTNAYDFGEKLKSQLSNFRTECDIHHFDYISPLDYYDKYQGEKIIIYYEDFVINTEDNLLKVIGFINGDIKKIGDFIGKLDSHKKKSAEIYNSLVPGGCKSINGKLVDINFHSKKMDNNTKNKIDSYISEKYKNLFDKYLSRYSE